MVSYRYNCSLADDTVQISREGGRESLGISFRRTIRVPDNDGTVDLPPDMGSFPLYKVKDYKDKLPENMVQKGGLFMPIHGLHYLLPSDSS